MMITIEAEPKQGKTRMAWAIAMMLRSAGVEVVLIDDDRPPRGALKPGELLRGFRDKVTIQTKARKIRASREQR